MTVKFDTIYNTNIMSTHVNQLYSEMILCLSTSGNFAN